MDNRTSYSTEHKIFCCQRVFNRHRFTFTFALNLVDANGVHQTLLGNLEGKKEALYVEQEIEQFLGLRSPIGMNVQPGPVKQIEMAPKDCD